MKNVLAALSIFTAGVCVGLLLAPEEGSKTRKRITDALSDLTERIKDLFQSAEEAESKPARETESSIRQ